MPTVQLFLDSSEALSGGTLEADVYRSKCRKILEQHEDDTSLCFTSAHNMTTIVNYHLSSKPQPHKSFEKV